MRIWDPERFNCPAKIECCYHIELQSLPFPCITWDSLYWLSTKKSLSLYDLVAFHSCSAFSTPAESKGRLVYSKNLWRFLSRRASFCFSISITPRPPSSLGTQTIFHAAFVVFCHWCHCPSIDSVFWSCQSSWLQFLVEIGCTCRRLVKM